MIRACLIPRAPHQVIPSVRLHVIPSVRHQVIPSVAEESKAVACKTHLLPP